MCTAASTFPTFQLSHSAGKYNAYGKLCGWPEVRFPRYNS